MRDQRIGRWLSGVAMVAIVVTGCAKGSGASAPRRERGRAPRAAASAGAARPGAERAARPPPPRPARAPATRATSS